MCISKKTEAKLLEKHFRAKFTTMNNRDNSQVPSDVCSKQFQFTYLRFKST